MVDADNSIYCIHPTKVDFFLQLFSVAATNGLTHKLDKMNVPTFIEYMETYKCDSEIDIAIRATQTRRGILCGGGEGFGASENEDDGAVKKYTHEEVILTKMP